MEDLSYLMERCSQVRDRGKHINLAIQLQACQNPNVSKKYIEVVSVLYNWIVKANKTLFYNNKKGLCAAK